MLDGMVLSIQKVLNFRQVAVCILGQAVHRTLEALFGGLGRLGIVISSKVFGATNRKVHFFAFPVGVEIAS